MKILLMSFIYEAVVSTVEVINQKRVKNVLHLGGYRLLTWRGSKADHKGFRYFYLLGSKDLKI